ncbi:MAG: M20/M25/M40 family metallo-hydrolase, partial [Roseivirga sp.]|nr:M20/M25/M40 family metallo-hydrolase [Roseivirga sp.]
EQIDIGVVEQVQGIYWTRYKVLGEANHAGTTPVYYRKDAGFAAAKIQQFIGKYTRRKEGKVLTTVGSVKLSPDAINIVPESAVFTLDVRSTDEALLRKAQKRIDKYIEETVEADELNFEREELVRFSPVRFPLSMTDSVQIATQSLGLTYKRMSSGAGHDAQMMAHFCPSTMIFIPSVRGISHNVEEFSHDKDVENGANVLLAAVLRKSSS